MELTPTAIVINAILIIALGISLIKGLIEGNSVLSLVVLGLVALIMLIIPNAVSKEASVVGIVFVAVGTVAGFIVALVASQLGNNDLPDVCKDWNKGWTMEWSLFLAGVLGHFAFEVMGANKWYCTGGHACLAQKSI